MWKGDVDLVIVKPRAIQDEKAEIVWRYTKGKGFAFRGKG